MRKTMTTCALALLAACGPADMDGERNEDEMVARGEDTAMVSGSGAPARAAAEAELMRLEREFAAASEREGAEAWAARWAPNGRTYFGEQSGVGPDVVRQRVGELIARDGNRLRWAPDTAVVSASGDLGYALGHYWVLGVGAQASDTVARGEYVTIWQKQADGEWKIVVDIGT